VAGLLGLTVVGAIVSDLTEDSSNENIALSPGVCIDGATFSGDEGKYDFSGDLEEASCADPHDAEVYYVFTDAQARRANASEAAFNSVGSEICVEEFAPYAGTSLARTELAIASIGPSVLGASFADDEVACFVTDPKGPMRGTVRGSEETEGDIPVEEKAVSELAAGDCIMEPSSEEATFAMEVVDCSDPHSGEVAGAFDLTGDEYPDDLETVVEARCIELFDAYVGKTFEESILNLFPLSPTPSSWDLGDREVLCVLTDLEGDPLTASMRGAGV
jgi:Septum formation